MAQTALRGTIKSISSCKRFGVVELAEPRDGLQYAVISDETKGRIALINTTEDGSLPRGMDVVVASFERGSEAFRALEVAQA